MPLIETSAREWIKTARTKFVEISGPRNLFSTWLQPPLEGLRLSYHFLLLTIPELLAQFCRAFSPL